MISEALVDYAVSLGAEEDKIREVLYKIKEFEDEEWEVYSTHAREYKIKTSFDCKMVKKCLQRFFLIFQ